MRADKGKLAWGAILLAVGVAGGQLVSAARQRVPANAIIITPAEVRPTLEPSPAPTPAPLRLYITGEVAEPGVYELPAGAIGRDLVEAAGGFTSAADAVAVNLALALADGMHLHVPAEGEADGPAIVSGGAGADGAPASGPAAGGLVNLNTATASELETLPGIGPVLAAEIVAHREANGPFAAVDEIVEVAGIGPATLEKIRAQVTVQ